VPAKRPLANKFEKSEVIKDVEGIPTISFIMDVNEQAVLDLLNQFQENMMLHGHTHRPGVHELAFTSPINGQIIGQRIVLGDWNNKAWYAETQNKEISLLSFDLVS